MENLNFTQLHSGSQETIDKGNSNFCQCTCQCTCYIVRFRDCIMLVLKLAESEVWLSHYQIATSCEIASGDSGTPYKGLSYLSMIKPLCYLPEHA